MPVIGVYSVKGTRSQESAATIQKVGWFIPSLLASYNWLLTPVSWLLSVA